MKNPNEQVKYDIENVNGADGPVIEMVCIGIAKNL